MQAMSRAISGALLLLMASTLAFPDPLLYACASFTKEYVVGAKLPPSGLFRRTEDAKWRHAGFNHPFVFAFEADPADPATLFIAAGNGLIRAVHQAEQWTTLTASD